ncbi:MAG: enoyl-CoA hydratase/isomerase family protein [Aeromicrobium sp.]|uniref:enoyl-CoA hydratase/isomerase family protein n=1 Tax=Aeromicrobium sp. TaxID=1871063 RepID=UPI00263488FE|nr:enoyl-CoA hydratase/isomerase family protein [Aeromicrobium sp.]MDF1705948.1 enoyl-CoA hydratase/isomerase family protein [Aeromicrobium sp.]
MDDEQPRGVRFDSDEGVGRIVLDRPGLANAMDLSAARAFGAAVDAASGPDIRALTLTGTGERFCAGGDISSFLAHGDASTYMRTLATELEGHLRRLSDLPVPVVCGVHGAVAGAGLAFVLNADLVVAGTSTKFVFAYPRIGLTPDCGVSWRLPRVIGERRAMEMSLLGRAVTADEACEWGLVNEVVADGAVESRVAGLAREIAGGPAHGLGQSRRLLRQAWETDRQQNASDEIETLLRLHSSHESRALIATFLARHGPTKERL